MKELFARLVAVCALIGGFNQALDAQTIIRATSAPGSHDVVPTVAAVNAIPVLAVPSGINITTSAAYPVGIEVLVYPNPSSEAIWVEASEPADGFIQGASLVNYLGMVVESAIPHTSPNVVIGVGHLPEGFYTLMVLTANGIISRKVQVI